MEVGFPVKNEAEEEPSIYEPEEKIALADSDASATEQAVC